MATRYNKKSSYGLKMLSIITVVAYALKGNKFNGTETTRAFRKKSCYLRI